MTALRAGDIAGHLHGRLDGDPERRIAGVRALEAAGANELAVVLHPRLLRRCQPAAGALVMVDGEGAGAAGHDCVIRVADPHLALVQLLHLFHPESRRSGIEPDAHVAPTARLAPGVFVAAGASVGAGAELARGVEIHANAAIGDGVEIGEDSVVFPNATLYPGTRVGRRVRIHAGAVIGSDGFGYLPRQDRGFLKVPQVGVVEIGDDVEIGANCTIDRATLEATCIGDGVKLDNLVHVGHNCTVGEHCMLVAQVGVSGSVRIGAHSMLLGQAGVVDHVTIEPRTVVGAQAGVTRDLGPGEWFGSPAIAAREARRAYPLIGHLPEQRRQLAALERRCAGLEAALARLEGALARR